MQALRDLQPLLLSPQVGLAAKAALIYASGYAEDHDKEMAVNKLATELDVSQLHRLHDCAESKHESCLVL